MIITAFLKLLEAFLRLLIIPLRSLPDVVLDSNITSALSDASESLDIVSTVVPISAFLALIAYFVTVEGSIIVWKGVNWLIRKIHGVN